MSHWGDFCSELDIGALVPEQLARYRPVVADAISLFLVNLPGDRAVQILTEQMRLPEEAGIDERLVAIARHCPVLHKLGQILARDRRLSARLRHHLQSLESMVPASGTAHIRETLENELGSLSRLGVSVEDQPLAEASVAQVIPFAWQRSAGDPERRGVFKVLKPGIEEKLEEEVEILRQVGAWLDERCETYGLPKIPYESTFEQVADLLRLEVRLDKEQEHLEAARRAYADMGSVLVPEVYPFCTPRVTAMERVDGCKVTDGGGMPTDDCQKLAALITEALIARPIWSPGPLTMFHADPHAGNLFLADDGRLAILDWSLVGTLRKDDQINLCQILLGAMTTNAAQIEGAVTHMAGGAIDGEALRAIVAARLATMGGGRPWPGIAWLVGLLDDAVRNACARFRADLMAFRKSLMTLEGVIADVSVDCSSDAVLATSFLKQMVREWGRRTMAVPFSRDFATHVSNLDLAHLMAFVPLATFQRVWNGLLFPPQGPTGAFFQSSEHPV